MKLYSGKSSLKKMASVFLLLAFNLQLSHAAEFHLEEATISDIRAAILNKKLTATQLVESRPWSRGIEFAPGGT